MLKTTTKAATPVVSWLYWLVFQAQFDHHKENKIGGREMDLKAIHVFASFGIFAGLLSPVSAASPALIEAARKEGRVVWYTTQVVDQFVRPAVDAFDKKYGIKVDYVRSGTPDIVLRVTNETNAGAGQGDIVDGTSSSAALKRQGMLTRFIPENNFPREFVDPEGYWIANNLYVLTPGFNTSLLPKGSEPRSYDDLLDPKWKGRIGWSVPPANMLAPEFVGMILTEMGDDKGRAYLRKLASQNLSGHPVSGRQLLDLVIAGEFPVGLQIFNNHAVISAGKGAPSDWIPMQPGIGLLSVASITKLAPHPNAARLFMEYLVSEEGQKLMAASGELPVHPDVQPMDPKLRPDGKTFRAVTFSPEELDEKLPAWLKIFNEIFR